MMLWRSLQPKQIVIAANVLTSFMKNWQPDRQSVRNIRGAAGPQSPATPPAPLKAENLAGQSKP